MPLNAKLVVVGGDVKTAEIKLRLPSTVGRGRGTTIMLPHPLVSRQHCELFEVNGQLMVRDLGSLNGTFVNNQRITESPLPPGELLTIGTVTFRAMYESQPDSQPPPGAGPQIKPPRRNETDADLPGATMPAPAKPAAKQSPSATPDSGDMEFDFEELATPVEEDDAPPPANANHVTKRMEETLEDSPGPTKTATAASAKTKPAPPKTSPPVKGAPPVAKPLPATPAASKDAAKTPAPSPAKSPTPTPGKPPEKGEVEFKWKEEGGDDEEVKADEDDGDLGDFLKSLGK